MNKKNQNIIVGVIALIIFVLIIIKNLPSEKKMVARDIKALAQNVEQEYWTAVIAYLDPAYADPAGRTYPDLTALFNDLFREADSIHVMLTNIKPFIDSVRNQAVYARCSLGVRVWANFGPDRALVFGGAVQPAAVQAHLKKTGGRYRLYRAEY